MLNPDLKVKVINASLGGYPFDQNVLDAIKRANDAGILFVSTTGNVDPNINPSPYPGAYWRSMAVSATDFEGQHASYSVTSPNNSVAAPGGTESDINKQILGAKLDGGFGHFGVGTSYAAPHVSGLAALLLERFPTMTWESLQYRIEDTANDMNIGTLPGYDQELGWGRINAYNAIWTTSSLTHTYPTTSNWQFVSLPVWPVGLNPTDRSNDIATLFPGANVDVYWWQPDLTNPNQGTYLPYSNSAVPRFGVGQSYYMRFYQGSNSMTYSGAYAYNQANHLFPVYLHKGFNQVAVPYQPGQYVTWTTFSTGANNPVLIRSGNASGTSVQPVLDAKNAGVVPTTTLYRFVPPSPNDPTGHNEVVPEGTVLNPFEGYWFKVNEDCEILFPSSATRSVSDMPGSMQWHAVDLPHQVGRRDGDGWAANMAQDTGGFMLYGPYTNQVAVGNNTAAWDVMIDNNTAGNSRVMYLDVRDATDGAVLAYRDVLRSAFTAVNAYQAFTIPFNLPASRAGHQIEFRLFYDANAYIRARIVRCAR